MTILFVVFDDFVSSIWRFYSLYLTFSFIIINYLLYFQLGKNEILNIDAIIEGALHECVIYPLKQTIYTLFVSEYNRYVHSHLISYIIVTVVIRYSLNAGEFRK